MCGIAYRLKTLLKQKIGLSVLSRRKVDGHCEKSNFPSTYVISFNAQAELNWSVIMLDATTEIEKTMPATFTQSMMFIRTFPQRSKYISLLKFLTYLVFLFGLTYMV